MAASRNRAVTKRSRRLRPAVLYLLIGALLIGEMVAGCAGKAGPTAVPANRAPAVPSDPVPFDGAAVSDSCACIIYLSWTGTDPDAGDSLRYDLYLGKTNPPAKLDSNIVQSRYLPSAFDTNSVYYWKVTVRDKAGLETAGPVWQFTVMP